MQESGWCCIGVVSSSFLLSGHDDALNEPACTL